MSGTVIQETNKKYMDVIRRFMKDKIKEGVFYEEVVIDGEYYLSKSMCLNKGFYRHIDKIYQKNKKLYDEYAEKSPYLKESKKHSLIQEIYFKKVLGILSYGDDEDVLYILKMCYKKVYQFIKNSKGSVSIYELYLYIAKIYKDKESIKPEEGHGFLFAAIVLAKNEGKDLDISYTDLLMETINSSFEIKMYCEHKLSISNLSKNEKKRLRTIQMKICEKYPFLKSGCFVEECNKETPKELELDVDELLDLLNGNVSAKDLFTKKTETKVKKNKREDSIENALKWLLSLNNVELPSIIKNMEIKPVEIQEILNVYDTIVEPIDENNIDFKKLKDYLNSAIIVKFLIKAFNEAKDCYFKDIKKIEINEIEEKDRKISIIQQKNTDLDAKCKKLKNETDKEISKLKEEIRILKNKNTQLEKKCADKDSEELNQLRNLMFELSLDEGEINNKSYNKDVDIDKLNSLNVICLGGLDNWITAMKEKLPNWTFVAAGVENYDTALLKNRDYIFINTRANTHGMYYKAIENKNKNTKLRYINNLNIDRALREIEKSL